MRLGIETITPIHIGNGEILSPYLDCIIDQSKIYYIDLELLTGYFKQVSNSDDLIDEFVKIVSNQAAGNAPEKFTLKHFFDKHQIDFKNYIAKEVDCEGDIKGHQIHRLLTSNGNPFIPGSTLKGAIRTAILYDHMKRKGYNSRIISDYDKNISYIGQDVFLKYGNDLLKFLLVSDSSVGDESIIKVIRTDKVNLVENGSSIPQVREIIPSNVNFSFDLKTTADSFRIKANIPNSKYSDMRKYANFESDFGYLFNNEVDVFTTINQLYSDLLKWEINELKKDDQKRFKNIISVYTSIRNDIKEFQNKKNGFVLRIGAGKTFFENSIARILKSDDLDNVRKRLQCADYEPFPITRTVILSGEEVKGVLGWIKVKTI